MLIAFVSCVGWAGSQEKNEINAGVGGRPPPPPTPNSVTGFCAEARPRATLQLQAAPTVPLSQGPGKLRPPRPFPEPGPGTEARWRKRKRSGFPSLRIAPKVGPAGPGGRKKMAFSDRNAV